MAQVVKLTTEQLVERLATLERERGMSAQEFYDLYRAGELGDSIEVMTLAGLCHMAFRAGVLTSQPLPA